LQKVQQMTTDSQPMNDRQSSARAAREALAKMMAEGCAADADDSLLDLLALELSEQMTRELAKRWAAATMGCPTSTKLAVMAERFYLEAAVAALDA
jgi:hypothetical protein